MTEFGTIDNNILEGFSQIDQLKGDNWIPWKTRVTALLTLGDLLKFVDGTHLCPHDDCLKKEWNAKDLQTRCLLQLAVGDSELMHLSDAKTAAEMWTRLREIKEPKGILGPLAARCKLFRIVAADNTPIIDHIAAFRRAKENLDIMGHPIADDEFAMLLATSLPESWDMFTSSFFGSKGEPKVKSSELITLIIDEDGCRHVPIAPKLAI